MNPILQIPHCKSKCGICNSDAAYPIESRDRAGNPLQVVICAECGVVHNDPIPTAAELSTFYAEEYRAAYKGTNEPKLRHAARYFPKVARHIHHHWKHYRGVKNILDIGSGSGEFLFLMRELGKGVSGVEPTRDYAHFCRTRFGLNVVTAEIASFEPKSQFDHIRLCHVVEHLRDPVGNLRMISEWLTDGGTMYVEVPDFERYCRDKTPGRIFHYGHIYNFDHDTFEFMVGRAGLVVVERVGPAAAFLTRSGQASSSEPSPKWPISEKIGFYQQHKSGQLRMQNRLVRFVSKSIKFWKEHRFIASHPDHTSLAKQVAQSLRSKLPQ